jgi:hypothetical protein
MKTKKDDANSPDSETEDPSPNVHAINLVCGWMKKLKCTSAIAALLLISMMVSVSFEVSALRMQAAPRGVVIACFNGGNQNQHKLARAEERLIK